MAGQIIPYELFLEAARARGRPFGPVTDQPAKNVDVSLYKECLYLDALRVMAVATHEIFTVKPLNIAHMQHTGRLFPDPRTGFARFARLLGELRYQRLLTPSLQECETDINHITHMALADPKDTHIQEAFSLLRQKVIENSVASDHPDYGSLRRQAAHQNTQMDVLRLSLALHDRLGVTLLAHIQAYGDVRAVNICTSDFVADIDTSSAESRLLAYLSMKPAQPKPKV